MTANDQPDQDDTLRLDDQLCFALYAATNEVVRAYRPMLRRIGLTYPQYLALMVLWEEDGLSLTSLAARLHLPVNGILPVIERLQTAGFVTRRQSRRDGRVVTVELTHAGADLEREAFVAQRRVVCQTGLDVATLDSMVDQLHALRDRMIAGPAEDTWQSVAAVSQHG